MSGSTPVELESAFWGSVNTWECDENDHQNVRFYAHKINQALQAWVAARRGDPGMTSQVLPAIRSQHIRFVREARAATPVRVDCGVRACDGRTLTVTAIMYNNATGEPLAAFQTDLDTRGWLGQWPAQSPTEVPDYAAPRGLDPENPPRPPETLDAALAAGYQIVGRGVIGTEECLPGGELLPHVYIGRVSDGMPNLWLLVNSAEDSAARAGGALGGAALEYHLNIHQPLRVGDVYTHLSGIRAIGNKTQTLAHLVFSARTGRCAASATAVGVAMDLSTRKAVEIPPERRARLEAMRIND